MQIEYPSRINERRMVEYRFRDEWKTQSAWAKALGTSKYSIKRRIEAGVPLNKTARHIYCEGGDFDGKWMTVMQLSKALGMAKSTIQRRIHDGEFKQLAPPIKDRRVRPKAKLPPRPLADMDDRVIAKDVGCPLLASFASMRTGHENARASRS